MNRWTQREIVVVAAIGVVFGVVYLAWVQLWLVLQAAMGQLSMDLVFGLWFVASVLAAYVVRKPGAAFFAEVVAAVAEVATGNPAGLILLLTGVIQGAGAELPFAATRWRRYDWPVLLASGASAAVFSFVYTWIRFKYGALDTGLVVTMFVLRVVSGMVLGSVLGKVLGDGLLKTGAVDGLRIDQDRRAAHA
jgi:energy-coupling factor transport system substrate-specific component